MDVKRGVCLISGVGSVMSLEIVLAAVRVRAVCSAMGFVGVDQEVGGVRVVSSGTMEIARWDLGRLR